MIIDNSPHAYAYQPSNGIPIESWFDEDDDEELLKALSFLDELHPLDDVRSAVIDHFRTHELIEESRNQALLSANTTSNTSSSSTTAATANLNTSSSSGSSSSTSNITQALSRTIVSPNSPGGRMNGRRV